MADRVGAKRHVESGVVESGVALLAVLGSDDRIVLTDADERRLLSRARECVRVVGPREESVQRGGPAEPFGLFD
ncbi:hypothetical protein DWB78_13275 [Halopelagius longus]|uniref:Uncharacterized protein n=1 Tax=Halopelagius longus TaxID=1236180 RepID=A0A370IPI2_9EURY|nr:hypothetical protein DWB78_13275 [Halopelagius longus]